MKKNKPSTQSPNKKKLDCKKYLKNGVTEEHILKLYAGFKRFDPEDTGVINVQDLRKFAVRRNFEGPKLHVLDILDQYSSESNGELTFDEFVDIYSLAISRTATKETLSTLFKLLDMRHEDSLTPQTIMKMAETVKLPLTIQQARLITEMHGKSEPGKYLIQEQLMLAINPHIFQKKKEDNKNQKRK